MWREVWDWWVNFHDLWLFCESMVSLRWKLSVLNVVTLNTHTWKNGLPCRTSLVLEPGDFQVTF